MTERGRPAWGIGVATISRGRVLDVWYVYLGLGELPAERRGPYGVPAGVASLAGADPTRGVNLEAIVTEIDLAAPPASTADAYLRLHLISNRILTPTEVDIDAVMAHLPLNVWTTAGPCATTNFEEVRLRQRIDGKGTIEQVLAVARIPHMVDYIIPTGVAIADGSRVRLGAYLAKGTKVTSEGFIDAGGGTLGPAYVQGRISRGVLVCGGTHVGGSASLLPPEDGAAPLVIGADCLIGANAGVGIALGDRCVVEAGLFLTPGTKVSVRTGAHPHLRVVSARELAGLPGMLFRRNSTTGVVEAFEQDAPPSVRA